MLDLLPKYDKINVDKKCYVNQIKNKSGEFSEERPAFGISYPPSLALCLFLEDRMKKCKVAGCNRKHLAKGYCTKHYARWKKWGNPSIVNHYYPTPELIAAGMKRCPMCGKIKSYSEFSKSRSRKDRYANQCKKCDTIKREERKKKFNGLYNVWANMKQRCSNPKSDHYKYYCGRGIIVCQEWQDSFLSFYNWAIKNGHKRGLQIDRRNNDGNYCPENCRFITGTENIRNSTATIIDVDRAKRIKKLLLKGKLTPKEIGNMFGVSRTIIYRIRKKFTWKEIT